MSRLRIALVSCGCISRGACFMYDTLSSATVQCVARYLECFTGVDVEKFPSAPVTLRKKSGDYTVQALVREISKYKPDITALSVTTDSRVLLSVLSPMLRKAMPDVPIIAGGVHYEREKIFSNRLERHVMDSVEETLKAGDADIVIPRNALPMSRLDMSGVVKWHRSGRNKSLDAPKGVFYMDGNIVAGENSDEVMDIGMVPFSLIYDGKRNGFKLMVMGKMGCGNRCDYCSISDWSRVNRSVDEVVGFVTDLLKHSRKRSVGITRLELMDSNPCKSMGYYEALFEKMRSEGVDCCTGFAIDPHYLVDDATYKRVLELVKLARCDDIFIARDTVSGCVAESIGRKFNGRIRTGKDIHKEGEGEARFVRDFPKYVVTGNKPMIIQAHIITPFDNEQTIGMALDYIESIVKAAGDSVTMMPSFVILQPYPGTRVRKEYIDMMWEPEDFTHLSIGANPWDLRYHPQLGNFMNKIVKACHTVNVENAETWLRLRRGFYRECFKPGASLDIQKPYRPGAERILALNS